MSYPARNVVLTLHAAGVKQERCFALAGVSGVGKSTLSALLAHAGWELLGDDIVAIEINQNVQQTPSLGLLRFPAAISRATHGRYGFVRPYHHS
jgi:ABC-type dipeptide/oligopeptide/nickel transport system ATPase subunit